MKQFPYRIRITADFILVAKDEADAKQAAYRELKQVNRWTPEQAEIIIDLIHAEDEIPSGWKGGLPWGTEDDMRTVEDYIPGPLEQLAQQAE